MREVWLLEGDRSERNSATHEALHPGAGSDRLVDDLHPTTPAATPNVGQPPGVQGGGKDQPPPTS